MRNYWKQLGVWATRLKADPFVSVRIQLTFLYAVSMISVSLIGYFLIGKSGIFSYEKITALFLVLAGITGIMGFLISSEILAPIRQIVRAQKRFIADASHELRTPLSIMKINSELALMEGLELKADDAIATFTNNMEEINRMSKLIEQLLALSFYDNKMIDIPSTVVDLAEVATEIVRKTQSLAHQKNVSLVLAKAESSIIMGSPTAMEQLVMNLIKNAIVYTPSGGKVSVTVTHISNESILKVQDTGIGISQEELPNIFNPFYKTDHSKKMADGTGLGLTIVKKIVERHKGTIYVESEQGKGALFTVIMPSA